MAFFDPIAVSTEYEMMDWPLHITLADVFSLDVTGEALDKLSDYLKGQKPVALRAAQDAVLGTTNVTLIDKSPELQTLHLKIVDVLESSGVVFNNPEFTKEGFLPHATISANARLQEGDEKYISYVSIIDMFPNDDWRQRKVLRNFEFRKN